MKICLGCDARFDRTGWTCPSCGFSPRVGEIVEFPTEHLGEALDDRSFGDLHRVEAGSFWFRSRNRLIAWALRTYFADARTFLEIGCGTGFVLQGLRRAFPSLALSGAELGKKGLAVAHQRVPDAALYALDANRLPFEAEFDVIGAFDVIEHVDDDRGVLAQLHRVLRPSGGLILTVPQHRWLWSPADDYSGHRRRYERGPLGEMLRRVGFRVLRSTSFISLLLPVLAMSRLAQRRRRAYDPLAEYHASAPVDTLLEGVQSMEATAIAHGLSFPLGGSLLFVARREP